MAVKVIIKGTVSAISSEPPCKDGNLIINVEDFVVILDLKVLNS